MIFVYFAWRTKWWAGFGKHMVPRHVSTRYNTQMPRDVSLHLVFLWDLCGIHRDLAADICLWWENICLNVGKNQETDWKNETSWK